jgi:hypothetical protein
VIAQESSFVDDLFANTKDELVIDLSKVQIADPVPSSGSPSVF